MTTIEPELQLVMLVTVVLLNLTVLVPCVDPNPLPAIVTDAPTAPDVSERLDIEGPTACAGIATNVRKATMATKCVTRAQLLIWRTVPSDNHSQKSCLKRNSR